MTKQVIQFGQLEEFMAEPFVPDQVVRVVVLEISEGVSAQIPDLRQVSVGVHIRTVNSDEHVLACYLPVATVRLDRDSRWVVERFPANSIIEDGDHVVAELPVTSERWLRTLLLQLGPGAEVVDPPEWRSLAAAAAAALLARYDG